MSARLPFAIVAVSEISAVTVGSPFSGPASARAPDWPVGLRIALGSCIDPFHIKTRMTWARHQAVGVAGR